MNHLITAPEVASFFQDARVSDAHGAAAADAEWWSGVVYNARAQDPETDQEYCAECAECAYNRAYKSAFSDFMGPGFVIGADDISNPYATR